MSVGTPPYKSKGYALLKGEAFVAGLLDSGFSYDKLIIQRAGSFAKSYRNDIEYVKNRTDERDQDVLHISLNRDGIYDRLPEGLFHQPRANGGKTTVTQMVEEHRRLKEEEQAVRRFFQPLEHELFRYSVFIEQEERAFLAGMLSGNMDNAFSRFWNLHPDLPEELSTALARVMPWASLIKGDVALCAKALEIMLGKPVSIRIKVEECQKNEDCYYLGQGELGIDTLSGSSFDEPSLSWIFTLQALSAEQVEAFVSDERYRCFLQQFIDIFIPLEADAVFEYELEEQAEAVGESILGYSFVL